MGQDDPTIRNRAEEIFHGFLVQMRSGKDIQPEDFLATVAKELRSEVETLVSDYLSLRKILGERPRHLEPGQVFGDFVLKHELGHGGMGIVFEAEQISLPRRVALKLLLPHQSLSPLSLRRFLREAEAGARLRHPAIVTVYELGEHDGIHFISQELIPDGLTLADLLLLDTDSADEDVLDHAQVARLFLNLAWGLHESHQAGVIHRDIKPSNILIDRDRNPKIADFGLAHVEEELHLSRTGELAGTPAYMSPEQAGLNPRNIDGRTDIFSLGSTLYEALTRRRAFDGESAQQILQQIQLKDPVHPQRIRPQIPDDLSIICMKCLEKEPVRRYESMKELAEDLQRTLDHKPILACAPSLRERLAKWSRRHRILATTGLVSLVAMITVLILSIDLLQEKERGNQQAMMVKSYAKSLRDHEKIVDDAQATLEIKESERIFALDQARWKTYLANLRTTELHQKNGHPEEAIERLFACPREHRGWEWHHLRKSLDPSFLVLPGPTSFPALSLHPSGEKLYLRVGRTIWVGDPQTGLPIHLLRSHRSTVFCISVDSTGERLASGSADFTLRLWDTETGALLATSSALPHPPIAVRLTNNGDLVAAITGQNKHVFLWAPKTGELTEFPVNKSPSNLELSSTPETLWVSHGKEISVWSLPSRRKIGRLEGHTDRVTDLGLSPDEKHLVTASMDGTARVWDLGTNSLQSVLTANGEPVRSIALSNGAERVATASENSTILWDGRNGQRLGTFTGHAGGIGDLSLSSDGTILASASEDGSTRLFSTRRSSSTWKFGQSEAAVTDLTITGDGPWLVAGSKDSTVRLWPVQHTLSPSPKEPEQRVMHARSSVNTVGVAPRRGLLLSGEKDGNLRFWDLSTGKLQKTIPHPDSAAVSIAISRTEKIAITGSTGKSICIWDLENLSLKKTLSGDGFTHALALSSDEKLAYSAAPFGVGLTTWDLESGQRLQTFPASETTGVVTALALSKDGRLLLSGSSDRRTRLWEARTAQSLLILNRHRAPVTGVGFLPHDRIFSTSKDSILQIHTHDGEPLASLGGSQSGINCAAATPDGQYIVTGDEDGAIFVWDGGVRPQDWSDPIHRQSVFSALRSLWAPDSVYETMEVALDEAHLETRAREDARLLALSWDDPRTSPARLDFSSLPESNGTDRCRFLARQLETWIRHKNTVAANQLLDLDRLFLRAIQGITLDEQELVDSRAGFLDSFRFFERIQTQVALGFDYSFLRTHVLQQRESAIFRLLGPQGEFTYHAYVLAESGTAFEDIFVYNAGEFVSKSMNRVFERMFTNDGDPTSPGEEELLSRVDRVSQISNVYQAGTFEEALTLYHTLTPSEQQNKTLLLLLTDNGRRSSPEDHRKARSLVDLHHGNDPSLSFIFLDQMLSDQQYARALQAIESISQQVGGDPFLLVQKAIAHLGLSDRMLAKDLCLEALNEDPDLIIASTTLLQISLEEQDNATSGRLVEELHRRGILQIRSLPQTPLYESFVQSEEFRILCERLKITTDAPNPGE